MRASLIIIMILLVWFSRDGMIKRPGTENYLKKLIEEERKAYLEFLEVNKKGQDDISDNEDGLIMMKQSNI